MKRIAAVALLVPDYDLALDFYVGTLGFRVLEDRELANGKRWVRIAPEAAPEGERGTSLLLARAVGPAQTAAVGAQAGGRVGFFLQTDDHARDRAAMEEAGVFFEEPTRQEPYGRVAVFRDPFGNRWDLIEPAADGGA